MVVCVCVLWTYIVCMCSVLVLARVHNNSYYGLLVLVNKTHTTFPQQ